MFSVVALSLAGHATASADTATTAEYAHDFYVAMNLKPTPPSTYYVDLTGSSPDALYISAMGYAFPGTNFDGKQMHANPTTPISRELIFKSFVYYKTFPLPNLDESNEIISAKVNNFSGLHYSDDSKPYIACLLKLGMDPGWVANNSALSRDQERALISKLATQFGNRALEVITASNPSVISNFNTVLSQPYYPDGPVQNQFTVKSKLGPESHLHQFTSILGTVDLDTPSTEYGIGIWGAANTNVASGKIVGGFFTAKGTGDGANAQLVGEEIDVLNYGAPGESKNSSTGMQIVTIGSANSTAAIQIISDNRSRWDHGIIIEDNSIGPNGTIFGVSQTEPVKVGLDMSNISFSDSAIHLKSGQMIKWSSPDFKHGAAIQLSDAGYFVLDGGENGFAVKGADWDTNLLIVHNNGDVELNKGSLIMSSPNGSRFRISVDNNGALKTSRLSGPTGN